MRKYFWLSLLALLFVSINVKGQEEKFKAVFMYNFTKYLQWPNSKHSGDFVIGVYGASPIFNELTVIAEKKGVGTQKIVVVKISEPSKISKCHIVYLPENRSAKADEVLRFCKGNGVVFISDKPGLCKTHSGINYVKVNGKQNFEINKKRLESEGIKVNSALLSLGILVE